jgi:hypothetical protein
MASLTKKPNYIGSKNFDLIIRWFGCLTKYSDIGGDEELGYAAGLCDTFIDSTALKRRFKILAKSDPEIREFRKWLLDYARNVGANCR